MNTTNLQYLKCPTCPLVLATTDSSVDDLQHHLRTIHHKSFSKNCLSQYLFEDEN